MKRLKYEKWQEIDLSMKDVPEISHGKQCTWKFQIPRNAKTFAIQGNEQYGVTTYNYCFQVLVDDSTPPATAERKA